MTVADWALGLACIACIWVAPYLGARRLVNRLLPDQAGPPAVLAGLVLAMVLVTLVSEVLGSVGQFRRGPLVAGCLIVGGLSVRVGRARSTRLPRRRPDMATLLSGGLAAAVFTRWAIGSWASLQWGIFTEDTIQYHLPFAASFAESGSLSRLHYAWLDPVWTFYPYGSEIFHAIGIEAFGRDVMSPVLNLGWLAVALLAAWCCGLRWNVGPLTLAMGSVVLSLPVLTVSQPGSANSDVACLALLLTAAALLFTVADTSGGFLLAAVAAGLAATTTLYAVPAVAGLAAGVLLFGRRSVPPKRLLLGALGVVVAGGYWYLRNLIRVGNPFPGLRIGSWHLPAPNFPVVDLFGFSVAHYLPDSWFWKHYVGPGLYSSFGTGWPVLAALTLAGAATPLARNCHPLLRAVWLGGAVAAVVYVFTPTSAYGPLNQPFLFSANLRFLVPSVTWFLMLAAVSPCRPRWLERRFTAAVSGETVRVAMVVALGFFTLAYPSGAGQVWSHHLVVAAIGAASALLVLALALLPRPRLRVLGGGALLVTLIVAGLPVADRYLAHRYTGRGPIYQWARNLTGARIGIVAFAEQYPLFGLRLDNRVSYVGSVGARGSLLLATDCRQWRQQLSRGRYDFVVIGQNDWTSAPIPELAWTESDPAAKALVVTSRSDPGPQGAVFRLRPGLDTTAGCSADAGPPTPPNLTAAVPGGFAKAADE